MKKLLIVTPGFYPAKTYGGPVTSIYNLISTLGREIEFYVVTSNHELKDQTPLTGISQGWNETETARILYLADADMTLKKFGSIIREVDPDCIYINAPYHTKTTPKLLYWARKLHKRIVLATRGGLNPNAINYGKLKKELYLRAIGLLFNDRTVLQSTSKEETEAIRQRFRNTQVYEIPNMPKPPYFDGVPEKRHKEKGTVRMIYVSRILPIKNLLFALKVLKEVRATVYFDIYGPKESPDYWNSCQRVIENELPPNIHVKYCGYLDKENLRNTYSGYDMFILPTESENFGHAIAEALYEKCPVLISDNTPWTDINDYGVGRAASLGSPKQFTEYIEYIAGLSQEKLRGINNKIPDYLNRHFDYAVLASQYTDLFFE